MTELIVAPGDETDINITLRTTGLTNPVRQTLAFVTNDPASKIVSVEISGAINSVLVVRPERMSMIYSDSTNKSQQDFLFTLHDSDSIFEAVEVKTPHNFIHSELIERQDKQLKLRVSLDENTPSGELECKVIVNLTISGSVIEHTIPIGGMVDNTYTSEPSFVSFSHTRGEIERSIKLDPTINLARHSLQLFPEDFRDRISVELVDQSAIKITLKSGHNFQLNQSAQILVVDHTTGHAILSIPVYIVSNRW